MMEGNGRSLISRGPTKWESLEGWQDIHIESPSSLPNTGIARSVFLLLLMWLPLCLGECVTVRTEQKVTWLRNASWSRDVTRQRSSAAHRLDPSILIHSSGDISLISGDRAISLAVSPKAAVDSGKILNLGKRFSSSEKFFDVWEALPWLCWSNAYDFKSW